ncbi:MAG: RNA polymerase sigma factor [Bacteroidetes bacterium]|nr:RNA polymerase sigma factor [Bacteroidota bacterium]
MFFKKEVNTEQELIKRCIAGSEKHCKELFESYYGKLLNCCLRYSTNEDEAKDMLQEGFIRIFQNLSKFSFDGSFEGWLKRIVVNTAINYNKKYVYNSKINYYDNDDIGYLEGQSVAVIIEENALDKFYAQDILSAIQSLSPIYRMVFNMAAIEGYSHKEIAEELSITESTSRSNLAKAKIKLIGLLEKKNEKKLVHEAV